MKTIHLAAALTIFAVSGAVMANGEYTDPTAGFVSSKTRAQVLAEVEQARAQGLLDRNNEIVYFDQPNVGASGRAGARQSATSKTRAQVHRELEQARADGLLDRHSEAAPSYVGV
jgi:hypothetical protein